MVRIYEVIRTHRSSRSLGSARRIPNWKNDIEDLAAHGTMELGYCEPSCTTRRIDLLRGFFVVDRNQGWEGRKCGCWASVWRTVRRYIGIYGHYVILT